jgi:predicted aspartyl protease
VIRGHFSNEDNVPYVAVGIFFAGELHYVNCILDTGFSGDLKIDRRTANEIGFSEPVQGYYATNANGERVRAGVVRGYAEMESRRASVGILVVDGAPLVGIGLLTVFGYKITIDCRMKTIYLERMGNL